MTEATNKLRAQLDDLRKDMKDKLPQKWGTMGQRLQYIQIQLSLGTLAFIDGTLLFFMNIGLKTYVFFPLIFYGIILLLMRTLVLWLISIMIQIGRPLVVILNAILDFFWFEYNVFVEAGKIMISTINSILSLPVVSLIGLHIHAPLKPWKKIPDISYAEFEETLRSVLTAAPNFDSMPKISLFLMRVVLHDYTCPLVRYTWPVDFVYSLSSGVFSWTYYGSAVPLLETGMNCDAASDVTAADYICVGLGIGYLFLELFLPFLILFLMILFLGGAITKLFRLFLYLLENAIIVSTEVALTVLDFVFV